MKENSSCRVYDLPIQPNSIGGEDCDLVKYGENMKSFEEWYEKFLNDPTMSYFIKNEYWVGFWLDTPKKNENQKYILKRTFTQIVAFTNDESIRMKLGKKIGEKFTYRFKEPCYVEIASGELLKHGDNPRFFVSSTLL